MLAVALLVSCGKPAPPPSSPGEPAPPSADERARAAAAVANKDLLLDTWRAARVGDVAGVKKGLAGGISVNEREPDGGSTLLTTATIHGRVEIAKLLLDEGADPNLENNKGESALHAAAFRAGLAAVVTRMLSAGADPLDLQGTGDTPLAVAARAGVDPGTVRVLLRAAAAYTDDMLASALAELCLQYAKPNISIPRKASMRSQSPQDASAAIDASTSAGV